MSEYDSGFSMITFIPSYSKKVPNNLELAFVGIEVENYLTVSPG